MVQHDVMVTPRLVLRPFELSDVAALHAVFSRPDAMRYWSTPPHESEAVTAELVRQTIAADPSETVEFVIEHDRRVIGKAGFWRMPEIGFILHPDFWRRGFGEEALRAVIDLGFDRRGLKRITADVDPENTASLRLLGKLGFVETGRAKDTLQIGEKWYDSVYLALDAPKKVRPASKADGPR